MLVPDRNPSPEQRAALWQAIRNERPIPPRGAQRDLYPVVKVTAWVYWEHDGLELVDTTAHVWAQCAGTGRDLMVWLPDHRRQISWTWLDVRDVRRR